MRILKYIPGFLCAAILFFLISGVYRNRPVERVECFTDTIYVREVIRDTVLIPQKIYIARFDTVYMAVRDSLSGDLPDTLPEDPAAGYIIPIERKVYETNFYRAVIEGYKPELLEMSVFPETRYVVNTEVRTIKKKPRFGVGIQTGYGFSGDKLKPYIGVGVQYNLFSF